MEGVEEKKKKQLKILQGLGAGLGSATEFFVVVEIFLLVMPKYWGKQIITHRSFPEVGEKKKAEKKKRKRKRKKEKKKQMLNAAPQCVNKGGK